MNKIIKYIKEELAYVKTEKYPPVPMRWADLVNYIIS